MEMKTTTNFVFAIGFPFNGRLRREREKKITTNSDATTYNTAADDDDDHSIDIVIEIGSKQKM